MMNGTDQEKKGKQAMNRKLLLAYPLDVQELFFFGAEPVFVPFPTTLAIGGYDIPRDEIDVYLHGWQLGWEETRVVYFDEDRLAVIIVECNREGYLFTFKDLASYTEGLRSSLESPLPW